MKQDKSGPPMMNLLEGPVPKTLLLFSIPFMISTLLQTLYATIDTIVVGQVLGSSGLSAVSNASQLMQVSYMIVIGFSTSGQVLISQAEGAGDKKSTVQVIGSTFWLNIIVSVIMGILFIFGCNPLLRVLDTPKEAWIQAGYYMIICSAGLLFTGLYNMYSSVFRGLGDSMHPLFFVLIASAVNIVLDVVFVVLFRWNVAGAALATVIGQMVSAFVSHWYLMRHAGEYGLELKIHQMKMKREMSIKIIRIGIPGAVTVCAVQISFIFVARLINQLGVVMSAAFGVTQKLRNIPQILTQAFGMGATAMIGQNLGAHRQDRVSATVRWTIVYCGIINAVSALVFLTAPAVCFRAFTQEAEILSLAGMCMFCIAIELPGKTLMPGCSSLISAQGFVTFSLITGFIDAFAGRIFLTWLLGIHFRLGAFGFLLGNSLGTYLTAIPQFLYFISGLWKKRKNLILPQ